MNRAIRLGSHRLALAIAAIAAAAMLSMSPVPAPAAERWTEAKANAWYDRQPWLVGSNYTPATAINQLEMWQADTFDPVPIGKRYNVAMYNWGLVDGKTQTRFPWDSWQRPYVSQEPTIWFHDVLRADGTPYRAAETDFIRRLSAAPKRVIPDK